MSYNAELTDRSVLLGACVVLRCFNATNELITQRLASWRKKGICPPVIYEILRLRIPIFSILHKRFRQKNQSRSSVKREVFLEHISQPYFNTVSIYSISCVKDLFSCVFIQKILCQSIVNFHVKIVRDKIFTTYITFSLIQGRQNEMRPEDIV